jgi:hypothetical protein
MAHERPFASPHGLQAIPYDLQVAGQDYIVDSLVIQYKLVKGRYERSHHRLDVLSTSRYLLNRNLESAFSAPSAEDRL